VTTSLARVVGRSLKTQGSVLGGTVAVFWASFAATGILGISLFQYGVIPRTEVGLRGILFAPFIHASFAHLVANTIPFLILGWLVMLRDARHFLPVTALSMLFAGSAAWLLGPPASVHIGASGVIFGYLGFLMLAGWFARSPGAVLLSIVVTVLWGGLVFGVMPGQPGVSWQSHLGGLIGGAMAARMYRN
jgi:membrane associated rhomboid family serine protease